MSYYEKNGPSLKKQVSMSLSKFHNKYAKNGQIFKNQVSNFIKIRF